MSVKQTVSCRYMYMDAFSCAGIYQGAVQNEVLTTYALLACA